MKPKPGDVVYNTVTNGIEILIHTDGFYLWVVRFGEMQEWGKYSVNSLKFSHVDDLYYVGVL